jgi:hypothetical protein
VFLRGLSRWPRPSETSGCRLTSMGILFDILELAELTHELIFRHDVSVYQDERQGRASMRAASPKSHCTFAFASRFRRSTVSRQKSECLEAVHVFVPARSSFPSAPSRASIMSRHSISKHTRNTSHRRTGRKHS